jgi:RNA polymerase sigma factor (sigma-70 family)
LGSRLGMNVGGRPNLGGVPVVYEGVHTVAEGEGAMTRVLPDESVAPEHGVEFAAWVRPHLAALTAFAILEVGVSDADDIVQETLVRAWRRRSTFDAARGSARAWLAAILRDRARQHRVRLRPHPVGVVREAATDLSSRDEVDAAVSALPRRQREVVTLHYLLDLPVREVAAVLSISEGSVKSHLFDARAALRKTLESS